jgi:spore maturation protein CgeB
VVRGPYTFPEYCRYNSKPLKKLMFIAMGDGNFNKVFRNWKGIEYKEMFYNEIIKAESRDVFNQKLIKEIDKFRPDVIFSQIHDAGNIQVSTMEQIRSTMDIPWINFCGDMAHDNMPHWFNDIGKYSYTVFSNTEYITNISRQGYRSYWMNHFDTTQYMPLPGLPKKYDVVFLGSKYTQFPLDFFRNQMVEELYNKYKDRFGAFGNSWGQLPHRVAHREEANFIYNSSKIAINCSQVEAGRYTSDRLMHIMASGTFCLCHYFPGCEELLGEDGYSVRYFKTLEELHELCAYYLPRDKEREEIAARAVKVVHEVFGDEVVKRKIQQIYQFI